MIYEAEEAQLSGLTVEKKLSGFSGNGYVTGFTNDTGSVTFTVEVSSTALYKLTVGYATPYGYKKSNLLVNGVGQGEVEFVEVPGFAEAPAGSILLNEGSNTITLEKGWGWYVIDYIKIEPTENPDQHQVVKELINPNATKEAVSLLSFLVDHYGKNILSGQQVYPNDNLIDVQFIYQQTGKKPAVLGLDFIDNSPSRVERGTSADEVKVAIDWWNNEGGIAAFTWHWNAPKDLIDQPGKEWWRGFYTDSTTFDLQYALNHPDSEDYQLLFRDIDAISAELKKLQDANVPVLWRPLHEAEGGWFWWGAKGPEPAKELWKIMYDRMTNYHKLNNLIWVWNSVSPEWYPGDEYVDIVSYDSYPGNYNYAPISNYFERLVELVDNKKLIAMAENGPIPDPDLLPLYHANWSWFSTWNGSVLRDQNTIDHLKKVYSHDYVLTLDELPNLKTYLSDSVSTQFTQLDDSINRFSADGQLGKPIVSQLSNDLRQAEKHFQKGQFKQAIKKLEDIKKSLDNPGQQKNIEHDAKRFLKVNTNVLILSLKE
ncbi:hypothetical protein KHA93_00020 [Bacillus sp. FJAT-49732]|uniref:Mannan endo-1,4-beta-mannosidase n=2 Tax=Lederbergia citrisecunda TaxID=2833583 RepID=A0A942TLB1_9BACI|nr:glycosyl hydrolase [Lederbergia citrisecunda]MBS4198044.1 hypothetical protein [Lederbergia citrisecunda]